MQMKSTKTGLCANVIIDGKIMQNNLKNMNKTEEWLTKQIKIQGYKNPSPILLATLDINDKLTIYKKSTDKAKEILE